jgi:hypothetical protein
MKMISKETKTYKLFTALRAGEKLTQSDAVKRYILILAKQVMALPLLNTRWAIHPVKL